MSSLTYTYPYSSDISSITRGNPTVVVTTAAHGLLSGNITLVNTVYNGTMPQINGLYGVATVLSPTSVSLPIDSTNFDAFATNANQAAQLIPIAEINSTLQNAEQQIGPRNPLT